MKTVKSLKNLIITATVIFNTAALCGPDINPVYPTDPEQPQENTMKATLSADELEVVNGNESSLDFTLTGYSGTGDLTVSLSKTIEGVSVSHVFDKSSGKGTVTITSASERESMYPLYVVFSYGSRTCKESLLLCLTAPPTITDLAFSDGDVSKDYRFMEYERRFTLMLNNDYDFISLDVPQECQSWLTVTQDDTDRKKFTFHLESNDGDTERTASFAVRVTGASYTLPIRISQVGARMKGSMTYGLKALYDATQQRGWKNHDNWGSDKPVCEWYGLSSPFISFMNGSKTYVGDMDLWDIVLFGNRLKGTVPDDFWDICHVFRKIDFSANYNNEVPSDDFTCERYLVGSTIPGSIWNPNLQYIDFRDCGIAIPLGPEIANAVNLQYMEFRGCNANGAAIPSEITTLPRLKYIGLGNCNISGGIPENIGNLHELEALDLYMDENVTGTIPDSFYALKNFRTANFSYTRISGTISPKIGNLTALETFSVSATQMEGTIPEEFGLCKNLWHVSFGISHFTNIPEFYRYWPSYNGEWDGWANYDFIGAEQFYPGHVWNWRNDRSFVPYENKQSMQYLYRLPLPKWERERYGLISWLERSLADDENPDFNPEYPYARDLQYPADQYYYDANLKVWTHPAYNGKAAKRYHKVNGTWTYDANFDWTSPAD